MSELAIIGGTGALKLFPSQGVEAVTTPFGAPSDRPRRIRLGQSEALFLARHGNPHRIPPHRINYRANIQALRSLGVRTILAVNAVGGISPEMPAGALVIPDQLIDMTWGRAHTFSDGGSAPLQHIDFTHPFDPALRNTLIKAAKLAGHAVFPRGCIAVTQGPRLETAAEVRMLAAAGCDLVGMTAMPEAALAREAGLGYASVCAVANAGAGVDDQAITEQAIFAVLEPAMKQVAEVLTQAAELLYPQSDTGSD